MQIRAAATYEIHRHGRACPGHPRDAAPSVPASGDARNKSGHDEVGVRVPSD
jgi:hypothetical protein